MRELVLIILRWFIFYPIILPIVILISIPFLVIIPWRWIERQRYLKYTGYTKTKRRIRSSKPLKKFTNIVEKPFLIIASIDELFNIK